MGRPGDNSLLLPSVNKLPVYAPRMSMACLLLCMISGAVLTCQYHPFGDVFRNVEEITTGIPYGFFFRRLHYASGELFVILLLAHFIDHFLKHRYRRYPPGKWVRLVIPVLMGFFILFTGYILKGDKEGIYAGNIFYNLLRDIPFFGETAAAFFIRPGETFFWLPYLYHCFFLPVLLLFLINGHIKTWLPEANVFLLTTAGLFAYVLLVKMPLDIPPSARMTLVKGPWFFLGLQVCLRAIPPVFAGIAVPLLFLGLVLLLPLLSGKIQTAAHHLIILSSLLYAFLILFGNFFMDHQWVASV